MRKRHQYRQNHIKPPYRPLPRLPRLARQEPPAVSSGLPLAISQSAYTGTRSVFWCQCPANAAIVKFADRNIVQLVHREDGETIPDVVDGETKVVVPGLCPFHMVGTEDTDQAALCGGFHTHIHEHKTLAVQEPITGGSLVLRYNLVTVPMPIDILIKSPELRMVSLYVYRDKIFNGSSPKLYQKVDHGVVLDPGFDGKQHLDHYPNPTCRRLLQQHAMEPLWKLDEEYIYSLEEWTRRIGSSNVFMYRTRNKVPFPPDKRFHSGSNSFKIAFGFWTEFQQEMWKYFLENDTGPCYLDAVYQPSTDGFQIWALFFERNSQPVPVSYLITTGVSMQLISDWLFDIVQTVPNLPKKTLFANIFKHHLLQQVFETWSIRYSKYYIAQVVRKQVLRKKGSASDELKQAACSINSSFSKSLTAILKLSSDAAFCIFSENSQKWLPRQSRDMAEFNYSADAVCRWRFQLWVAMLSRPNTTRIDSVLYHLVDVIEPQVRVAMEDAGMEGAGEPFSLDTIENGHINATGHPYMSPRKIGSKLFYVHRHDNLQSRTITDTHLNVCYCEVFMRRGLCEHLIFCAPDDIHHPQLPKLLCEIPDA